MSKLFFFTACAAAVAVGAPALAAPPAGGGPPPGVGMGASMGAQGAAHAAGMPNPSLQGSTNAAVGSNAYGAFTSTQGGASTSESTALNNDETQTSGTAQGAAHARGTPHPSQQGSTQSNVGSNAYGNYSPRTGGASTSSTPSKSKRSSNHGTMSRGGTSPDR